MPLKLEYKKKSSADSARWRAKIKLMELMCPIYKRKCIGTNCMSFNKGNTYQQAKYGKPNIWKIYPPQCVNGIVTGAIEMEMP